MTRASNYGAFTLYGVGIPLLTYSTRAPNFNSIDSLETINYNGIGFNPIPFKFGLLAFHSPLLS